MSDIDQDLPVKLLLKGAKIQSVLSDHGYCLATMVANSASVG